MARHARRAEGRRRRITGFAAAGALTALLGGAALTGAAFADDGHWNHTDGTPCSKHARACVDLAHNQAWLIHDGEVTRGPVGISHGGQGKETPTGDFEVQWKDKDHRSAEFNDAPMPYSVFFADGGIAFHEGNPQNPSAGCVHLGHDDAVAWYADLEVGDEVEIH
ncbi:L,D-transpeptidase [Pseudonocardia halophobica]|uniref:L,D-transpeptidase n=1 Tax=Pseudonocardia halophobica TaxID=29401 RepID=UPI003D90DDED